MGPRKKKKSGGRLKKTATPARIIEYISVPIHWFSDPLNRSMKTVVRPPTKLTRRKQQTIELKIPLKVFVNPMRPFNDGELSGLAWQDTNKTELKPTKEYKTFLEYKYTVTKPSMIDRLWRLNGQEPAERPGKKRDKSGVIIPYRRGHGGSRLHLSKAAAERGERSDLISQVTGNVTLKLKAPRWERAMPTIRLTMATSSMDQNGHVLWANNYSDKTAAALRKQMRHHLTEMINDPEYPTLTHMESALTLTSDTFPPPPTTTTEYPTLTHMESALTLTSD